MSTLSTSNPTWLRIPRDESEKISIDENIFGDAFILEMERLANLVNFRSSACKMPAKSEISVGDTRVLPLKSNCIDAVITSPPYCTRLSYASHDAGTFDFGICQTSIVLLYKTEANGCVYS